MKPRSAALLLFAIVVVLLFLAWLTLTKRLGKSRHGYTAAAAATRIPG